MRTAAVLMMTAGISVAQTQLPPASTAKVDYDKDVRPLLSQKCYSCHGDEAQQSGLRLDKRQNALRGGDYGPVIVPGDSAKSKLIRRLVNGDGGLQMPPTGPLSKEEIGLLRAWIDQGAEFRIEVEQEKAPPPVDPRLAALVSAVRSRDNEAVDKLATAELVKAQDASGATALHHAAAFGSIETMRLLIDRGAEVNAVNRRKSTPLFWALNDLSKVKLLLERGANVNAKAVDGRTPVYQASMMGNAVPVLRLLLSKGGNANTPTIIGMTPLMAAARSNVNAMRLLLENGAHVNAQNGAGMTALMAAAGTGTAEAVRLLLDKGADVNVRTKRNETALDDASVAGDEEIVKLLIAKGADVNVQDIRGYSALLYAAGSDTVPAGAVKALLAAGASKEVKGDGETAAELAVKRGDTDVARILGAPEAERLALGVAEAPESSGKERSLSEAVKPALALLAKQSHNFIRIGGCNSCHAQDLPSAAAGIARSQGLTAPVLIPQLPANMHILNPARLIDLTAFGVAGVAWEMFDFGNNQVARNEYTDAAVHYMKSMQAEDGSWAGFQSKRPPMANGTYQATALAIYSVKTYGPPAEKEDTAKAIADAAAWLEASKPVNSQDCAFRTMGLAWANAKPAVIAEAAKTLAASQRADGGWAQLPSMGSDAYATGQVLYALSLAGKVNSPAYKKGMKYLLQTQAPDGTWHVKSRSIWLQPYFESGFPYGHDQWISAAGTAWAVIALSQSAEPQRITQNVR